MKHQLPIPVDCALSGQRKDEKATLQCHQSLICGRCGFCLAHCECGPAQRPQPVSRRLRRGEVDESQMTLCDKPALYY